jgi:hypothetical protein
MLSLREWLACRFIPNRRWVYLPRVRERRRRQQLLAATNAAYGKLRADPEAWQGVVAERSAWDSALGDGLEEG